MARPAFALRATAWQAIVEAKVALRSSAKRNEAGSYFSSTPVPAFFIQPRLAKDCKSIGNLGFTKVTGQ
jgi:hypothetical protein